MPDSFLVVRNFLLLQGEALKAFGWIWAVKMPPFSSEFILPLLLQAVGTSIKRSDPLSPAVIDGCVIVFHRWGGDLFGEQFLFPSHFHQSITQVQVHLTSYLHMTICPTTQQAFRCTLYQPGPFDLETGSHPQINLLRLLIAMLSLYDGWSIQIFWICSCSSGGFGGFQVVCSC